MDAQAGRGRPREPEKNGQPRGSAGTTFSQGVDMIKVLIAAVLAAASAAAQAQGFAMKNEGA